MAIAGSGLPITGPVQSIRRPQLGFLATVPLGGRHVVLTSKSLARERATVDFQQTEPVQNDHLHAFTDDERHPLQSNKLSHLKAD